MAKPKSIPRRKGPAEEYSFEALRSLGITRVQEMAGNIWTDYNAHDPGVTVLEQVCYALTDIAYRADFPVADFLVDEKGKIDWERQGLLQPEAALPTRATTASDYREIFLDAIPELKDVSIRVADGRVTGLYNIVLKLRSETLEHFEADPTPAASSDFETPNTDVPITEQVRKIFAKTRSLCEDIEQIIVEKTEDNTLRLNVHISETADYVSTVAGIHHAFANRMSSAPNFVAYETALMAGASPEEMFRGPLLHGGILSRSPQPVQSDLAQSDIRALIEAVPGVMQVTVATDAVPSSAHTDAVAQTFNKLDLNLLLNNREFAIAPQELDAQYDEINQTGLAMHSTQSTEGIIPLPRGSVRSLTEYLSVQYHFPAIYGVGPQGIPPSAPIERHALAKQLKGYLLFFDQSMADLLANMANMRELYSIEPNKHRGYYSQLLSPTSLPGLDELYDRDAVATMQASQDSQSSHERATHIIDYLLALYGESFPNGPFVAGNARHTQAEQDKAIDARIAYLKNIGQITNDRFRAIDVWSDEPDSSERSGLEEKLSHLLGFEAELASTGECISIVEHILLRPRNWKPADKQTIEFRISILFPSWPTRCGEQSFRMYAAQMVDLCCPTHIYADIYWLDQQQMKEFDRVYRRWRGSLGEESHRRRLAEFLSRLEHGNTNKQDTGHEGAHSS